MKLLRCKRKKLGNYLTFVFMLLELLQIRKIKKKVLGNIGEEIGLLFQLADDFLDKKGSRKLVGKPVKKDNKKGKSTLLKLLGEKKLICTLII